LSFIRVSSRSLDPHKQWYVLTIEMCGMRPADFAKMELFTKIFPDEKQRVQGWELKPAKSLTQREMPGSPASFQQGLCDKRSFILIG